MSWISQAWLLLALLAHCSTFLRCGASPGAVIAAVESSDGMSLDYSKAGVRVFDSVQVRVPLWGANDFNEDLARVVAFDPADVDKFCNDEGSASFEKYSEFVVIFDDASQAVINPCISSIQSVYMETLCSRISPRVVIATTGFFGSFGLANPGKDAPPGCGVFQAMPVTPGYALFLETQQAGPVLLNITSEDNHFMEALGNKFWPLLVTRYLACTTYLCLSIYAASILRYRRKEKTPPQIILVLVMNIILNFILAIAHALDGSGNVVPGMPYGWTGFFRSENTSQVTALDFLIMTVWNGMYHRLDSRERRDNAQFGMFRRWKAIYALISTWGWVVDLNNANIGTKIQVLIGLSISIGVVHFVVASSLIYSTTKALRVVQVGLAPSLSAKNAAALTSAQIGMQMRKKQFIERTTRATFTTALASLGLFVTSLFGAIIYFKSPLSQFTTQCMLCFLRSLCSFSQISVCGIQKPQSRKSVDM